MCMWLGIWLFVFDSGLATLYFTRYGLKGKVDVTVAIEETSDMNTRGHSSPTVQEDITPPVRNVRLPLELKTGKMFRKQGTIEHRAQVIFICI